MMNSRVSYNASLSSRFFFAIVDALSLPTEGRKEGSEEIKREESTLKVVEKLWTMDFVL